MTESSNATNVSQRLCPNAKITIDEFLQLLRDYDALRDQPRDGRQDELQTRLVTSEEPIYESNNILTKVNPAIRHALDVMDFHQLYEHQARAIELALSGSDVVLEAPTASGKTLAFAVPMIHRLLDQPGNHALLLHPMKALSNDQKRQIDQLASNLRGCREICCWRYDGDTEDEHKKLIRKDPPPILLTNPEMLHLSFLAYSDKHRNFLSSLCFIMIDEIHEYRGYFGSNVALLLRRFLLKLDQLGCRPQLFLATATCANSEQHAYNLTGRRCQVVKATRNMRPERIFVFIRPDIPDYQFYDIYKLRIARAALACASKHLSTIAFCPSRRFTEDVCKVAIREAKQFDIDPERIKPYKSGYLPEEREEIEEGLRDGKFLIVFSTNALELGIDIGRLDACILAGFPENVMSAWQRIGRTGRSWQKTAYVLFYAMNNAFDQFYAQNIDVFLDKPLDEIAISTDNDELIRRHIPYLLKEMDWNLPKNSDSIIGPAFYNRAMEEIRDKKKSGIVPNYKRLDIRGSSGQVYKLVHGSTEIGTISDAQRFREAYIGAIYTHCGKSYRVIAHTASEIELEETEHYFRTEPIFYTVVNQSDVIKGLRYDGKVAIHYGRITVFENFVGYKLIDDRTGEVIEDVAAETGRPLDASAFWMTVEDSALVQPALFEDGLRAIEHFLRIGASFVIPCDRHDTSTVARPPSVYLYETIGGGIGIAEKAFDVWGNILEVASSIASKCPCQDGCPRCIHPPRLPSADRLSKLAGLDLAKCLRDMASKGPTEHLDTGTYGWQII